MCRALPRGFGPSAWPWSRLFDTPLLQPVTTTQAASSDVSVGFATAFIAAILNAAMQVLTWTARADPNQRILENAKKKLLAKVLKRLKASER